MGFASRHSRSLKIRRQTVHLAVSVAGRIGTFAAADFLRPLGRQAITLGAPRRCFRQRALGRQRQRAFLHRAIFFRVPEANVWRCAIGWHCLELAKLRAGRKTSFLLDCSRPMDPE